MKATRPEKPRYLIYCEDKNAGVDYLHGIKNDLRANIKIGPEHGEPLRLVKAAVAHKHRAAGRPEDQRSPYDEVWCIIDIESPVPHERLDDALKMGSDNGIRVSTANPCFELWLHLHFERVGRQYTSAEMQSALHRLGRCRYDPRTKSILYAEFRELYATALGDAQWLRRHAGSNHRTNPWTDIDQLFEALRRDFGGGVRGR